MYSLIDLVLAGTSFKRIGPRLQLRRTEVLGSIAMSAQTFRCTDRKDLFMPMSILYHTLLHQ